MIVDLAAAAIAAIRPHQALRDRSYGCCYRHALAALWLLLLPLAAVASDDAERQAIALSQAAIGRAPGDMAFIDADGQPRRLSEYRGKPLLVSLVFSGCAHACSVTTRHIDRSVRVARDALGADSFNVVTIGFDTPVDTPQAMRGYARRFMISDPRWQFLSSDDAGAMQQLMDELGFVSRPSPRGFDHTVQLTVLDADGMVYRQVYGELFELPLLVEPLKQLVFGRPAPHDGALARLAKRVRLFCTVYDSKGDRYLFDYSLFAGILVGFVVLGGVSLWLLMEVRRRRRLLAS